MLLWLPAIVVAWLAAGALVAEVRGPLARRGGLHVLRIDPADIRRQ